MFYVHDSKNKWLEFIDYWLKGYSFMIFICYYQGRILFPKVLGHNKHFIGNNLHAKIEIYIVRLLGQTSLHISLYIKCSDF